MRIPFTKIEIARSSTIEARITEAEERGTAIVKRYAHNPAALRIAIAAQFNMADPKNLSDSARDSFSPRMSRAIEAFCNAVADERAAHLSPSAARNSG